MRIILVLMLFCFPLCETFAQTDTLQDRPLARVMDLIYQQSDSSIAVAISQYLTKRARLEKDSAAVSWGHYGNYLYKKYPNYLPYLDSLIYSTKGLGTIEELFGLLTSANYFYDNHEYNKALGLYIAARQLSLELNDKNYIKQTTSALADIKFLAGEYAEALNLYHRIKKIGDDDKLELHFNIANCHYELNNIDSLSFYSRLGIDKSITNNDTLSYAMFLKLNGVSHYKRGNLNRALDSLEKSRTLYFDTLNIGSSFYYSSLTYEAMGIKDSAIYYLNKITSLNQEPEVYFPEIKSVYLKLYENAKINKDDEEQLFFIEKYMEADSVLQAKSKGLISRIDMDYDLPLFEERRNQLRKAQSTRKKLTYAIVALSFLLISLAAFFLNRSIVQKRRINEAIGNPNEYLKNIPATLPITDSKRNQLPPELIEQLNKFFEEFEKNKGFLNPSISLNQLAPLANTNTSYLSNYLNAFKGGYSDYINGLRAQYAFSDMATNSKISIFTLEHIAKQYGFTSLRAFNRAFEKYIKIRPRDYLAQIKQRIL